MTGQGRVVVVGGGLAGTSAALDLADRGWDVTLLEGRPRLGGAAYSFLRDGSVVDTGQHVLLRCYRDYRALLERMGVADLAPLQDRMDLPVLRPGASPLRLRRTRSVVPPLHLAPALLGYRALSPLERARAARTMTALRRVDPDDPAVDRQTFGGWLRAHGERDRSLARLWGVFAVAALNVSVDEASLALAARVFRTALLERPDAGDIGVLSASLSRLHDTAARAQLDASGVRYRTGERVRMLVPTPDGFSVRTATGQTIADAVVLAVPHRQAADLVPPAACPDRHRWHWLGFSPIVNVHVRYDRPVSSVRFAAVLDSPVQWLFDRTEVVGGPGQYLVVSLSGADVAVGEPAERLLDVHLAALSALLPAARTATVLDSFVTREPHATFRQVAGTAALRPPTRTALPGLVLAGAWTGTGWPDTMEGAVRSGHAAARELGLPGRADRRTLSRAVVR
jgi:hydroxysqualene dehydroxylase